MSPPAHNRTNLSGDIFASKARIDNGKNSLSSNTSSRCAHNMANFGSLTAEICWRVWGTPANFNGFRVLVSLLPRRRSLQANQTLQDVWPSPGLEHYIYIFECCPPDGILPGAKFLAKFTLRPSLAFSYIDSITAADVSQTLRCGTRNGIMELSQRAPPIFAWAVITLGIGPYSSYGRPME